ncbi:hypothetical protein HWQ46_08120 [Shewanella sp. D64]|uniref:hypothetical protein n=1 Tax=unclassified Shewanella TaxID=196818 RepID=UPI0022BA6CC5|nr:MULTISPECIES: hypothetical protein [unclassified Shewanella]MEC4725509.1 hypothetical protein [Shewanella sp. D64]MEC4738672.1 hypothetical protein [Shewanella sp. E94]WBJ94969.1 hypothetical protein HWQ47_24575 [Shewanella sp. MTB7]
MAQMIDLAPDDAEIEAIAQPSSRREMDDIVHRRAIKKRLEDLLADAELQRAMGGDFY